MATTEDLKINAECIRMTDGGSNNYYYANVSLIVDGLAGKHHSKKKFNNNTVGHASENPKSPESLAQSKHKIVFIGPPGHVIVSERLRRASRTLMMGKIKANIIGFPIMIKASEGGGGKGIRKVENPDNFKQAFAQEFLVHRMRLARDARHHEVQALADQYGNAISLFGRDCSVQRRHQKIIEETPFTIKKQETFDLMERATVRLTKLVGCVSAGIVEYLYSHEIYFFCFLEFNPRLKVEHPTTEMVSGGNLPAQLQIATGIPFHQIRDIRVENVDVNFVNSDMVDELNFRSSTNVWGRFSVNYGGGLHEFADFNLVIFFAYEENRALTDENGPTQLRSLSPGKLVRFLVESGGHVIKMYMPLIATDGVIQFIKQQNSTLESGDIIGILTLDDLVEFATQAKHILECILDGYDNQAMLQSSIKKLIEILENSDLESHAVFSALSGRIPAKLEAAY
ncbi:5329_t:CDS:2 [Funneliformis geosporum]|uniref:5329_t:CDS:1 n=1 Tax=Funneliformis geosporum TaxID=1117311 RepID=A0A9W4SRG5_9GLOM|nr:5329_t:CDS:2 [Funneliformis geosporum]